LYEFVPAVKKHLQQLSDSEVGVANTIVNICEYMEEGDTQHARYIWVTDVMKLKPKAGKVLNLAGDERTSFGIYMKGLFDVLEVRSCKKCGVISHPYFPGNRVDKTVEGHVETINNVTTFSSHTIQCASNSSMVWFKFKDQTPLPVYRIEVDLGSLGLDQGYTAVLESRIPRSIMVLATMYKLFAATLMIDPEEKLGHFVAIFYVDEDRYLYDGLSRKLQRVTGKVLNKYVTCAYYILSL
jgi:hypothetical protein